MAAGNVRTCPKCGALITPQLSRCRQCGTYLHGTRLEGVLFEHLLPTGLRSAPGTGLIFLLIVLFYVFQVVIAGPQSALSFSTYSLRQLGAVYGIGIQMGEVWRFVTSMFAHGGAIHIAFNLYALSIIGPVVEEIFDRKKMWLITVVGGVLSMVASYAYGVEIRGSVLHTSVGASGAVSALLGAAIFGGKRAGPQWAPVVQQMIRWAIYIAIFGFLISGIDNAAHLGGFLVGAGLARVVPPGLTQTVAANRVLSVVMLSALAGIGLCFALMIGHIRGFPGHLEHDAQPAGFLFFQLREGAEWRSSTQYEATRLCERAVEAEEDDAVRTCEFATRAYPRAPSNWVNLMRALEADGQTIEARRIREALGGGHP
jgi:rhomboid protease GluP